MIFHSFTVFRKEAISSKNNFVDFSVAKSIYDNGFSVKSITHYHKGAGIEKEISLNNLRKAYPALVNRVKDMETKILSSYSIYGFLTEYYSDPTV
ncbi:hypothetical protein ACFX5D_02420 [Flavobacterium sp. LB3P45]|uniref:Uncharacterized protein n=1 Tax=Flavobacterium fructosi TaxID=3230416 RepID=A0ABW6HIH5_9FLAO